MKDVSIPECVWWTALKQIDVMNVGRWPGSRGILQNWSDVNIKGFDKCGRISRKKAAEYLGISLVGPLNNIIDVEVKFKFMVDCNAKISDRCDSGNWVVAYEIWIMILDSANG